MVETPSQIALSQQSRTPRRTSGDEADPERARERARVRPEDAESQRTAQAAGRAALEKKGDEVLLIDLRERSTYADFLVLCSGSNDRQLEAIADEIEKQLKEMGHRRIGKEGNAAGRWLLLDFGDIVVHVFHQEERGHYDLEGLWADAPQTRLAPLPPAALPTT